MARVQVTQADALQAIRDYLQDQLQLTSRQVYLSLDPMSPIIPMGGEQWYAVSPSDGRFDDALASGSVREQCTEDSSVTITGYSRVFTDSTDRDADLLLRETRGLLRVKLNILDALAGADIPLNNGDTFLRELMTPRNASAPEKGQIDDDDISLPINWVSVDFSCVFDWDLS